MTGPLPPAFGFEDAERAQLATWMRVDAGVKIDFFEEMVALAYRSGALAPKRLALRDEDVVPETVSRPAKR